MEPEDLFEIENFGCKLIDIPTRTLHLVIDVERFHVDVRWAEHFAPSSPFHKALEAELEIVDAVEAVDMGRYSATVYPAFHLLKAAERPDPARAVVGYEAGQLEQVVRDIAEALGNPEIQHVVRGMGFDTIMVTRGP